MSSKYIYIDSVEEEMSVDTASNKAGYDIDLFFIMQLLEMIR
jgi:hypothetical protein